MRKILLYFAVIILLYACNTTPEQRVESAHKAIETEEVNRDGVFIHVSHGPENPQRVSMALNMALLMSEDQDVVIYFDIKGIEVLLKNSEDFEFSHFQSCRTQLRELLKKEIKIMACPGCLKAAGKTEDDLMDGIQVADKETFFNFTNGRILTIDY